MVVYAHVTRVMSCLAGFRTRSRAIYRRDIPLDSGESKISYRIVSYRIDKTDNNAIDQSSDRLTWIDRDRYRRWLHEIHTYIHTYYIHCCFFLK